MQLNHQSKKFIGLLFLGSFGYALINIQVIPYLTTIGYTPEQRGLILAFAAFLSIVFQLTSGYLSDKLGTIKKIFIISTLLLIVTVYMGYSIHTLNFWFHFVILGIATSICRVCSNLLESWILESDKVRENFGLIRGFGSVGWAISSLFSAFLIIKFGYTGIAISFTFVSLILLIRSIGIEDVKKISSKTLAIKDVKLLFKNKNFVLLVIIFSSAFFVMNADNVTVVDYIFELKGGEFIVGLRWFIQGLIELPSFYFGSKLISKIGGKKFIFLTLVFIILRFGLYSISSTVVHIILVSLLQIVTFPFLIVAQRFLIFEESPSHLKSTAQMIAVSITMSFSAILTPLFSGYITRYTTLPQQLFIFALIGIIPLAVTFAYKQNKFQNNVSTSNIKN